METALCSFDTGQFDSSASCVSSCLRLSRVQFNPRMCMAPRKQLRIQLLFGLKVWKDIARLSVAKYSVFLKDMRGHKIGKEMKIVDPVDHMRTEGRTATLMLMCVDIRLKHSTVSFLARRYPYLSICSTVGFHQLQENCAQSD